MYRIDEAIAKGENLYVFNEETQRSEFPYKDELVESYNDLFTRVFGNINLDASTPVGQVITSLTQNDLTTIGDFENEINSFFFGGTGAYLDKWAWNTFRVTRKKGIPSIVNIKITGVPLTQITDDFLVTDGIYEYKIKEATVIPPSGFISVPFENTEIIDFIAPSNTIDTFVTVIDGVETIDNPASSIKAVLPETDDELFYRCQFFGATGRNSSFRSVLANVSEVQGVTKIAGAENPSDATITFKNISLTQHSICIAVLGGTDDDIANAIKESRPPGTEMIGTTEIIISEGGQDLEYRFYRPDAVPLKVRVEALISINSPTNWEDTIKDNVIAFIEDLNIAENLTQPQLAKHLYRTVSDFDIEDVRFSLKSGTLGYTSVQLDLNQMFTIDRADIEVVQA